MKYDFIPKAYYLIVYANTQTWNGYTPKNTNYKPLITKAVFQFMREEGHNYIFSSGETNHDNYDFNPICLANEQILDEPIQMIKHPGQGKLNWDVILEKVFNPNI